MFTLQSLACIKGVVLKRSRYSTGIRWVIATDVYNFLYYRSVVIAPLAKWDTTMFGETAVFDY